MIMQRVVNHELIEVKINSTGTNVFTFTNNVTDKLAGKLIVGVAAHHVSTVSVSPTNFTNINDNAFKMAFLSLQHASEDRITNLPFDVIKFSEKTPAATTALGAAAPFGYAMSNGFTPLNYLSVDFYKSKVTFANLASLVLNETIILSFLWVKKIPTAEIAKIRELNS